MTYWFPALVFVVTLGAMEGFAYVMHRWVMHGPGWFLHASHHRVRTGWFEWNDLYAAIFAVPSIILIYLGARQGWGASVVAAGAGIAGYGAIYFGFHDFLVHRRIPHGIMPRSAYMKRLIQAHRLHHAVESRTGAVSFGFLYAPPIKSLLAELRSSNAAHLRQPQGGEHHGRAHNPSRDGS